MSAQAQYQEVVTTSVVHDVPLPDGAGTLALVTLDNGHDHTRPTTLGPGGLAGLAATLDGLAARAASGEITAVAVTGKPYVFCAGADLTGAAGLRTPEQALETARTGHAVLRRLGELGVPSFAFVNGVALGGGVEIALHCTYRTVSAAAGALALPEVMLGIVPGWGGTHLLPNLVGPERAVEIVIANPLSNNRTLTPVTARATGLVDVVLDPADFLVESVRWAAGVLTGRIAVERAPVPREEQVWERVLAGARTAVDARLHGGAPAPYAALELLARARTDDRDAGFAAEDDALARLLLTPEARSSLYAFELVNKRAKRPAGAPDRSLARPVTSVGVVGAGLMAAQLALLFARRLQVPVVMTDLDDERVARGLGYVRREIDTLLGKGRLSADAANRLRGLVTGSTSPTAFAGASVVIEAVFERLDVKQQVLAQVESVVDAECVLMTNTSSLSVEAMTDGLKHPERVVGFHFFNPVAVMPLVEVIRTSRTDEATLATAFAVGRELRKTCVLVKDAPAFVVNRVLTRFLGAAIEAVDAGTPPDVADLALAPLGLPMTPFTLLQLVGPAVALHTGETLHEAFPERFGSSPFLARLVEAGLPGVWELDERGRPTLPDAVAALLPRAGTPLTAEQVRDRALEGLAQEIRLMLDEGVVASPLDVDLCMIMGGNWPFHLGGITPYLDRSGVAERVTGRRFLPPGVADVPA